MRYTMCYDIYDFANDFLIGMLDNIEYDVEFLKRKIGFDENDSLDWNVNKKTLIRCVIICLLKDRACPLGNDYDYVDEDFL